MYKRILVALDGSRAARLALDEAVKLAQAPEAKVIAVCVVEHAAQLVDLGTGFIDALPAGTAAEEAAQAILAEAAEVFAQHNVQGVTREEDAYGEGVTYVLARIAAEWEADLVVMGTHGRHGAQRALFGSVAESFLRHTELPVLLVRQQTAEPQTPSRV